MLTREEYEDLWKTHFTGVGIRKTTKEDDNPNTCPTDYCNYLIREHMFEDYLDIFRGRDTRAIRHIQLCEEWYYPHPYFENNVCLIDTPALKYIMIGEAAPSKSGTYFYDINQINTTAWLSAPVKAFFNAGMTTVPYMKPTNPTEKRDLLLELAKQGYLLIDLFPFALKYSGRIRTNLNHTGVSELFYKRLQTKIGDILIDLKEAPNADIKVAFSGPPIVHYYLADAIFLGRILPILGMFNIVNTFTPPTTIRIGAFHFGLGGIVRILNAKYIVPITLTRAPIYRSCCYDGTNQNPHELFIRNAFDLP